MSPTVFQARGYRFFFFSREEPRPHVHVQHESGEVKFWLEPVIEVAFVHGLGETRVRAALRLLQEHEDEVRAAWHEHFGR